MAQATHPGGASEAARHPIAANIAINSKVSSLKGPEVPCLWSLCPWNQAWGFEPCALEQLPGKSSRGNCIACLANVALCSYSQLVLCHRTTQKLLRKCTLCRSYGAPKWQSYAPIFTWGKPFAIIGSGNCGSLPRQTAIWWKSFLPALLVP